MPVPSTPITMVQALNLALHQGMAADNNVVVLGQDVALNGGVFRVTDGLQEAFGAHRVIDAPLSEAAIVGAAVGMAVAGMRPVVELQFADYMFPAFDQIVSEVAKLRYRSGGDCACPMVIRAPYGGGIRGGLYHSQSPEAYFCHTPGLTVVIPSTPQQAHGLLLAAMQHPDPVIFLEPKRLYRSTKEALPTTPLPLTIGPARVVQPGQHVSLFSYGSMLEVCQQAVAKLKEEQPHATVELIDLQTLYPMDEAAILTSVRKTGRAVLVAEAPRTCSYLSEIAALLAEQAVDSLQAPITRVTGLDTPFPYALEAVYLPHPARVLKALQDVLSYQ
jgi:2-oxoisovalerate dehydrogenase E1 component beta subunit